MRILLVSHGYPPRRAAGTENYTEDLARRLTERGHQVRVFAAAKDISKAHLSTEEREQAGVGVVEVFNNLHLRSFRETWDLPPVEELFAAELEAHPPDLVHIQHLLYLSCGLPRLARARGLPVFFTLHDFWLQCPRLGQRVHGDGSRCDEVEKSRCGSCMAEFKFAQSTTERTLGTAAARLRAAIGIDLGPMLLGAGEAARRRVPEAWIEPKPEQAARRADEIAERWTAILADLVPAVDRFLSPSRFLRDELIAFGIPPERITHLPLGIDRTLFPDTTEEGPPKGKGGPAGQAPRVGFLGTFVPLKGAHLLLQAWGDLSHEARRGATLELRGPREHDPAYQAKVDRLAADTDARIGPPLARAEVGAWLAAQDLLVLPSLWYENSPLVILEARAVGTPVLVSDLGGMAELVSDPAWRFPVGDREALARCLEERLASMAQGKEGREGVLDAAPPLDQRAHVDLLEELYRQAVGASPG